MIANVACSAVLALNISFPTSGIIVLLKQSELLLDIADFVLQDCKNNYKTI